MLWRLSFLCRQESEAVFSTPLGIQCSLSVLNVSCPRDCLTFCFPCSLGAPSAAVCTRTVWSRVGQQVGAALSPSVTLPCLFGAVNVCDPGSWTPGKARGAGDETQTPSAVGFPIGSGHGGVTEAQQRLRALPHTGVPCLAIWGHVRSSARAWPRVTLGLAV